MAKDVGYFFVFIVCFHLLVVLVVLFLPIVGRILFVLFRVWWLVLGVVVCIHNYYFYMSFLFVSIITLAFLTLVVCRDNKLLLKRVWKASDSLPFWLMGFKNLREKFMLKTAFLCGGWVWETMTTHDERLREFCVDGVFVMVFHVFVFYADS